MSVASEDAWAGWLCGLPLDPFGQIHLDHSSAAIAWCDHSRAEWHHCRAILELSLREQGEHPVHAYRVAWGSSPPHLWMCSIRLAGKACTAENPCRACATLLTDSDVLDEAQV